MISITIGYTSWYIITQIQTFKKDFVTFIAKVLFWDRRKIKVNIFITEKITKLIRDPEFHMAEGNSQDYHTLGDFR